MGYFALRDNEELEEALAVYQNLQAQRFIPKPNITSLGTRLILGELRTLAHHTFKGGERWTEWEPLFNALPPDERRVACEYMSQAWELPTPTQEAVGHDFCFRALKAGITAQRDVGFNVLPPPADEATIAQLEQNRGVTLPVYMRRFLLEISAGHNPMHVQSTNHVMFSIDNLHFFEHDSDDYIIWDSSNPTHQEVLARILHHFRVKGETKKFEFGLDKDLNSTPQYTDDRASEKLFILSAIGEYYGELMHFEFLITEGPLRGTVFHWHSVNVAQSGWVNYARGNISRWLLNEYGCDGMLQQHHIGYR